MSAAAIPPVAREIVLRMDAEDPLAAFRDRFVPMKDGASTWTATPLVASQRTPATW